MFCQRILAVSFASIALFACKSEEKSESKIAAPASSAAKTDTCKGEGGQIADALSAPFFPSQIGPYCLDRSGGSAFGEGGSLPLHEACASVFGAECEVYEKFGLRRMVEVRYTASDGAERPVQVYLSQFQSFEGAYGVFTKRLVADGDPLESALHKLEAGTAAAIGSDRAYVWRGFYLVQIQYAGGSAPEDAIMSPLASIAAEIGKRLHGGPRLPPAALRLPTDKRVPLGLLYSPDDALSLDGAGAGATGFYKDGDRRYRVLSIARANVDQATDTLKVFGRLRGATAMKGIGDGAYRAFWGGGEGGKAEWLVARSGSWVLGVGDEELSMKRAMPAVEREKICLSRDEKIRYLKELLGQ
jgi:hypothetical protein